MKTPSGAGRSAYGAASVRAMEMFVPGSQRLFDDGIVLHFLPGYAQFLLRRAWLRNMFTALFERGAPGIRGALLCRTCAIDDMVKAAVGRGLRNVVILGAGLDTRPYRLAELAGTTVFELDLATLQNFKRARLRDRFGAEPPHVRFVPIDFNSARLDEALANAGLDQNEPALFIWEGVTQYLQPEAVDAVLRAVAARPEGSELIFTYVLEDALTGKIAARKPEPWFFGIRPDLLAAFLAERGLTLRADLGAEEHINNYVNPRGRALFVSEIERVALAVPDTLHTTRRIRYN
jgi:methyltransferase (TIGR00027 family)